MAGHTADDENARARVGADGEELYRGGLVEAETVLDRDQDYKADGDHLEEDVDIIEIERIADNADHQRANQGVADMPAPAEKACAADDDGGGLSRILRVGPRIVMSRA